MLFDKGRELPVATLRRAPHSVFARMLGELQQWLAARWSWFLPRTLPVAVAIVGLFAVLGAVDYLRRAPAAAITMDDGPSTEPAPTYGFHVKLVVQQ
ncbi:MAG: hypothetical protein IPQ07_45135 [Myxococcales bacterium]|nr:hypothetical protein [Myxococcales bacterium]